MMLPRVPGIIEGTMTINSEPDGRVSFRVLVGTASGLTGKHDLLELIVSPEDLSRALAERPARTADQPPALHCHIGFCRNVADAVA
jgi:hypothetical protein